MRLEWIFLTIFIKLSPVFCDHSEKCVYNFKFGAMHNVRWRMNNTGIDLSFSDEKVHYIASIGKKCELKFAYEFDFEWSRQIGDFKQLKNAIRNILLDISANVELKSDGLQISLEEISVQEKRGNFTRIRWSGTCFEANKEDRDYGKCLTELDHLKGKMQQMELLHSIDMSVKESVSDGELMDLAEN